MAQKNENKDGFKYRISAGVGLLIYVVYSLVVKNLINRAPEQSGFNPFDIVSAIVCGVAGVALIVLAIKGKTSQGALTGTIVLSSLMLIFGIVLVLINLLNVKTMTGTAMAVSLALPSFVVYFEIFGIVGAVQGKKSLKEIQAQEAKVAKERAKAQAASAALRSADATFAQNNPDSLLAKILGEGEVDVTVLHGEQLVSATKVVSFYSEASGTKELYVRLRIAGYEDLFIGKYDRVKKAIVSVDDELSDRVYQDWLSMQNVAQPTAVPNGPKQKVKLDLYDSIISAKDWKEFRKEASEDELVVLAIGARYRLQGAQFFIKALIAVLGAIASVVIGIVCFAQLGMFSLFILLGGYFGCNLIASKLAGYSTTYSQCCRMLDKETKQEIEDMFPDNAVVDIFRSIVEFLLTIFLIPYQMILLFVSVIVPSFEKWAIAHGAGGGVVVSIPKGYDVGNLGAIGAYYASCTFSDVLMEHSEQLEKERLAKSYVVSEGGTKYTLTECGDGRYVDDTGRYWSEDSTTGKVHRE